MLKRKMMRKKKNKEKKLKNDCIYEWKFGSFFL